MAAQRVPPGAPAPAPVQRLRVRYARRGRLRFSSGRDFQRALERALRLARVPMAYSSGFHPHPRISYANAAPTGVASDAEYVELALAERVDPDELVRAVDAALPAGLDLLEAVEAGPGSLADRLEASHWRFVFDAADDGGYDATSQDGAAVDDEAGREDPVVGQPLHGALDRFLAAERVEVTRVTKSGPKTFDVREPVLSLELRRDVPRSEAGGPTTSAEPERRCAILEVVVRHTTPAVRPDDFLRALRSIGDFTPSTPPLVTRLAQGPLPGGQPPVADPLAVDRTVIGSSER